MKRKRGPAPHAKKSRLKPRIEERNSDEQSEGENDVVGEEDSFEGFSTDEDEENGEAAIKGDSSNTGVVNGSTGPTKKRGKKACAHTGRTYGACLPLKFISIQPFQTPS